MNTKKELEIIRHANMNFLEIFLVEMTARQPHGHDDMEIGILLDGEMTLTLEHVQYELKKGNIYIINRYQMHSFCHRDHRNGKNRILVFQIHTDLYRRLNQKLKYLRFDSNIIRSGFLHQELTKELLSCADCYFSEAPFFEIRASSLLLNALYLLLQQGKYTISSAQEYHSAQSSSQRINRITEYISEHYQEPLSLHTIAEMEHITTYHASHFITQTLGMSFQEYLNNIRFDHALRLLSQTDFSITDICIETGFSSSRYLNRMFEKKLGCSVKEYKKNKQTTIFKEQTLPVANIQKRFSRESSAFEFRKRISLSAGDALYSYQTKISADPDDEYDITN